TLVAFHERFKSAGFAWRSFCSVYGLAESTLVVSSGDRDADPTFLDADAAELARGRVVVRGHPEPGCHPERSEGSLSRRVHPIVSCGRATLGTRALIVDPDTLIPCADGVVGEIWVSSPSVAGGYWRREQET